MRPASLPTDNCSSAFRPGRGRSPNSLSRHSSSRHGAMVLRVCRAQLADHHDTLDAFQATFLILVKRARALWIRDSLGPWLHQVAFRTASCARANAARRHRHERRAAELAANRIRAAKTGPRPNWSECSTQRSTGSRTATAFQSCSVTSKLIPARRQRGGWAARWERSRAGVFAGGSGCATG